MTMGLEPRLIAGNFVGPYRMQGKAGKNDANDAAAVCEAASRSSMRFVPVKTAMQQGQLAVHRLREGYKQERTACLNRVRSLLTEFGIVIAQSPEALRRALPELLEDASNELSTLALQRAQMQWEAGLQYCLVRRVHSEPKLQRRKVQTWWHQKRGNDYLRTLLIQGAKSAVMTAHKRRDRISQWLVQLVSRVGWQKAVVALANKNARILWAVLVKGDPSTPTMSQSNPMGVPWPYPP